jgi:hypothetical protein
VILSLSMLLTPLAAETRPARSADRASLDSGYVSALAAADHFLQAWQAGDTENGLALLTSRAKQDATPEGIERFFSSAPAAYEIGRGKLLKHGRYEFPLVLVSGRKTHRVHRRFCSLVIVNTANNDWAVDKLP